MWLHARGPLAKPDIVLPTLRRIVEVRGCFWHQHPGCIDSHIPKSRISYWRPKLARNQRRDQTNSRKLRRLGWRVLVVWECEVKDSQELATRLRQFLRETNEIGRHHAVRARSGQVAKRRT